MSRTIAVLIPQGLIFLLQIISIFLCFNCHVKKKTFVWLRHRIVYGMVKGYSILININLNAQANGVHGPGRSFYGNRACHKTFLRGVLNSEPQNTEHQDYIPSCLQAFPELVRVTRPGGIIAWNIADGYEVRYVPWNVYQMVTRNMLCAYNENLFFLKYSDFSLSRSK